ncbi:MAG TPA: DUF4262 domain-containing protein, partial [Anaeromyxobacter sp.]
MQGDVAKVCRHVLDGKPILFAARDDDERDGFEWQFHCGAAAHAEPDGHAVALDEIVRRDASAIEIVLHPRGTVLERHEPASRWFTGTGPVLFPHRPSRRYPRFEPRYPPRPGEALDAGDLRVMADVAQEGLHVTVVADGAGSAPHAFTVGLFRTWDHSEVAFFGLARGELEGAIQGMVARIRTGERFEHGEYAEGVVPARTVTFRRIVPRHYPAHLGRAVWYHGGS